MSSIGADKDFCVRSITRRSSSPTDYDDYRSCNSTLSRRSSMPTEYSASVDPTTAPKETTENTTYTPRSTGYYSSIGIPYTEEPDEISAQSGVINATPSSIDNRSPKFTSVKWGETMPTLTSYLRDAPNMTSASRMRDWTRNASQGRRWADNWGSEFDCHEDYLTTGDFTKARTAVADYRRDEEPTRVTSRYTKPVSTSIADRWTYPYSETQAMTGASRFSRIVIHCKRGLDNTAKVFKTRHHRSRTTPSLVEPTRTEITTRPTPRNTADKYKEIITQQPTETQPTLAPRTIETIRHTQPVHTINTVETKPTETPTIKQSTGLWTKATKALTSKYFWTGLAVGTASHYCGAGLDTAAVFTGLTGLVTAGLNNQSKPVSTVKTDTELIETHFEHGTAITKKDGVFGPSDFVPEPTKTDATDITTPRQPSTKTGSRFFTSVFGKTKPATTEIPDTTPYLPTIMGSNSNVSDHTIREFLRTFHTTMQQAIPDEINRCQRAANLLPSRGDTSFEWKEFARGAGYDEEEAHKDRCTAQTVLNQKFGPWQAEQNRVAAIKQ